MTITDYVTVNTAKLLKQAGFPQEYKLSYGNTLIADDDGPLCRPSLWDAMKWLREEHKIFVIVDYYGYIDMLAVEVRLVPECSRVFAKREIIPYEQACDAGIYAACEYLISLKGHENAPKKA